MSEYYPEPQAQGVSGYGESLSDEWVEASAAQNQEAVRWGEMEPFPVKVVREENEQVSPASVGLGTYAIPQIPQASGAGGIEPLRVCKHSYHRYKAKFLFSGGGAGTIYVSKTPDALMSGALGAAFQIVVSGVLTQSVALMPDYDAEPALYMMASIAGFNVAVMDEGYKVVQ